MCQKTNSTKRFFVLLNHPAPLQRPLVLGVVKPTPLVSSIYETTRNTIFLNEKQIQELGYQAPNVNQAYMLPIDIPRDWFLH
jgi:hypothetical protein